MKLHKVMEEERPAPADETVDEVQLNQVSVMCGNTMRFCALFWYFSEVVFPARALFL